MKRDEVVGSQETKNPSCLSNLQPLTTTNLHKQRKRINHQGGVNEKLPELNLYNKETIHPLLKEIISMEEIDMLKEDNHFLGRKIFSMDIVFTALTLATKM
jgi:hypothetical protein